MSKYTITIKQLKKNNFDFGLQDYEIFDKDYREKLNNKILNHYYMSEIALETAELFKFYLNNKMNEIMPYYNNLYNAQLELLNNLYNTINITESLERENNGKTTTDNENKSNSSSNTNSKSRFHDTPQGKINYNDIENGKWLTNITLNDSESNIEDKTTNTGNGTIENKENYTKTIKGLNNNSYIDTFNKIRTNLINIDMAIINELEDLFFGLY